MSRNPAFGKWSEDETNWSDKDTAFMDEVIKNSSGSNPTSLKELKDSHENLLWEERHYRMAEESNRMFKTHTKDQEVDI